MNCCYCNEVEFSLKQFDLHFRISYWHESIRFSFHPSPSANFSRINNNVIDVRGSYEFSLLLGEIEHRWSYDFRDYARKSIQWRIQNIMMRQHMAYVSELIPRVLHEPEFFQDIVMDFNRD